MTDYADALRRELEAATAKARTATTNHDAALAAADRLASLIRTLDDARRKASDEAKALIGAAVQAGIDPRDFYGRPFSSTIVRDTAARVGVTFPHRGRRPRTRPSTDT